MALTTLDTLWSTLVCVLGVSVLFMIKYAMGNIRNDVPAIPMPPNPSWIWGHEKTVLDMKVGAAHRQWFETLCNSAIRIKGALRAPDILVLADPTAVAYIMQKKSYDYHHSSVVRPRMARLLGKSLSWVEDESEHKRMRAIFTPPLSSNPIRDALPDFFSVTSKLCDDLQSECSNSAGHSLVNILDWVGPIALRIIGRFGLGHDFSDEERDIIITTWRNMATMGMSRHGTLALLLLRRISFLNYLPVKAMKQQGKVRLTIRKHVGEQLLRDHDTIEGTAEGKNMLSRLLNMRADNQISTDEFLDHIVLFIMAGSETTNITLSYAIWELARHQDMQDRLRAEISQFAGREPSYDEFQTKLPYLDAVLRETLRLHPGVPYMERVATKDDVLPLSQPLITTDGRALTEISITAGQTIILPVHYMNRADSLWGDGAVFRPSRWLDGLPDQNRLPKGWSNLLTFSDGPRSCVGYRLANIEFKVIIFSLLQKFKFSDTGVDMTFKVTSTMQPCPAGKEHMGPSIPIHVYAITGPSVD